MVNTKRAEAPLPAGDTAALELPPFEETGLPAPPPEPAVGAGTWVTMTYAVPGQS